MLFSYLKTKYIIFIVFSPFFTMPIGYFDETISIHKL